MCGQREREDRKAAREPERDDRVGAIVLDNGGAVGVCGASCGPSV